jgi:hypothetical protein
VFFSLLGLGSQTKNFTARFRFDPKLLRESGLAQA